MNATQTFPTRKSRPNAQIVALLVLGLCAGLLIAGILTTHNGNSTPSVHISPAADVPADTATTVAVPAVGVTPTTAVPVAGPAPVQSAPAQTPVTQAAPSAAPQQSTPTSTLPQTHCPAPGSGGGPGLPGCIPSS